MPARSPSDQGDIWAPAIRGTALSAFVVGPFAGPALGPIVGGVSSRPGVPFPSLQIFADSRAPCLPCST